MIKNQFESIVHFENLNIALYFEVFKDYVPTFETAQSEVVTNYSTYTVDVLNEKYKRVM